MKKFIKTAAIIVGVLVLGIAAVFIINPLRLNPFDRIKGTVTVTVDGKPAEVTMGKLPAKSEIDIDGNVVKISSKGGYGSQEFNIFSGENAAVLRIYHANSYQTTKFDLTIDFHTDSNGMIYEYTATSRGGPDKELKNTDFLNNGSTIQIGSP